MISEPPDSTQADDAAQPDRHATLADARTAPIPDGTLAAPVLAHGTMVVEYYAPRGVDTQQPIRATSCTWSWLARGGS